MLVGGIATGRRTTRWSGRASRAAHRDRSATWKMIQYVDASSCSRISNLERAAQDYRFERSFLSPADFVRTEAK
jgi:hypothetical protein